MNEEIEESNNAPQLTLGEKIADSVAFWGGSWKFIGLFAFIMLIWITVNSMAFFKFIRFDPQPYVLLNLILSTVAALQAPIIMMSQNRQAEKDRANQQEDREVNRQAEIEIRNLKRQLTELQKSHEEDKRTRQEQTKTLHEIRNKLNK